MSSTIDRRELFRIEHTFLRNKRKIIYLHIYMHCFKIKYKFFGRKENTINVYQFLLINRTKKFLSNLGLTCLSVFPSSMGITVIKGAHHYFLT